MSRSGLADSGLWCARVHPGHADVLASALDRRWPFVLIEAWDGRPDWHEVAVSLGVHEEPRLRVVRRHSFDVLVTPEEATELAKQLRRQGLGGGGLRAYQFSRRPSAAFAAPAEPRGRSGAYRDQGVEVVIDLPHDGEVAVVCTPEEATLSAFLDRLA